MFGKTQIDDMEQTLHYRGTYSTIQAALDDCPQHLTRK